MDAMIYADVHAHLDLFSSEELEGVIERAKNKGVKAIVTSGVDVKSNRAALELAKSHSTSQGIISHGIIKAALGIYPTDALKMSDAEITAELDFIKKNSGTVAAIGEVGLDYLKSGKKEGRERQKEAFGRQIELATKLGKPLVVHSRRAEKEAVEMLISASAKKAVMHCCMADMKTIKKAADAGLYFSIPALILRSSHFKKLAETVPGSHLLTETDSPFLSPYQGRKSEPAMVGEAAKEIAKIKGITEYECAKILYSNYQKLFA
ncbi:TatD family hydrolase [Candidatus Woesearchaeota archaeon]|nr:TatD family hydrolase [Candidatus Woesearchaeota archaeon]